MKWRYRNSQIGTRLVDLLDEIDVVELDGDQDRVGILVELAIDAQSRLQKVDVLWLCHVRHAAVNTIHNKTIIEKNIQSQVLKHQAPRRRYKWEEKNITSNT